MPTATITREEIFRNGLKNVNGTVTSWCAKKNFGFVRLNGPIEIEYFVPGALLTSFERKRIMSGSQLLFDVAPGQPDVKKPKPRVSNPRLILPDAA